VKWEKDTLKGTRSGKITLEGSILYGGEEILSVPAHKLAERGLIICPERGRPFKELTVHENLLAGAYCIKDKKVVLDGIEKVYSLFPRLKERNRQIAGTLSGGERTMLAIGRALMSHAKLLLIDEPSVGLAPKIKEDLFERIKEVHKLGITILLTEQDVGFAFEVARRNYVMSKGKVLAHGTAHDLLTNEFIRRTYLGL
jgi:branched-chain amino acid transport system ATP-binding protein